MIVRCSSGWVDRRLCSGWFRREAAGKARCVKAVTIMPGHAGSARLQEFPAAGP
jgi:hypothetical protein